MKPEAFVADWKRKEVSQIQEFIEGSDVVGLVDVQALAQDKCCLCDPH